MVETLEPSFAYGPPMEAYLRSNYVQQGIKRETSERYTDYDDAELEGLAECLKNDVRQLSAPELAEHLDPDKGLSKIAVPQKSPCEPVCGCPAGIATSQHL